MRAMVFSKPNTPLQLLDLPIPQPLSHQVLIRVEACGVCRTDLHIFEGELIPPKLPLVLGHQIVGTIVQKGTDAHQFDLNTRVGVPWLGKSCGQCSFCNEENENLCNHAEYTGFSLNGGFAEYCVADENYIFPIPSSYSSVHAAPLLCAGLIGFRSLHLTGNAKRLGFFGFGSAAHVLIQIARSQRKEVWAFTRPGDNDAQQFALKLGAVWAGNVDQKIDVELDAALIFAPSGELIPLALKAIKKGGSVVCAGIHMSDIPSFPYSLLYGERILRSVTNLTREDGELFFEILKHVSVETSVTTYLLENANDALRDLKEGKINGSTVLAVT